MALVDVRTVAEHLGVSRDYVYSHAVELGARRLGTGPKARLRFDLAEVDRAVTCSLSRESQRPVSVVVEPIRRRRARKSLGTTVELLPIRGSVARSLAALRTDAREDDEMSETGVSSSSFGASRRGVR